MPTFSSAQVTDPTPNILYNPMMVDKAVNEAQTARQQIGATNIEMVGRAAGSLLGMSETDAAAAYPGMVANLQRNGFAMNAPSEYPGHAAVQGIVNSAIPLAKQYEYGILSARGLDDALKRSNDLLNPNSGSTGVGGGPRASSVVGGDQIANAKAIHAGLVARGMDNETALAMSANLLGESGGNWQTRPGDGGASHGIAQWNKERLAAFQAANGGKLPAQTSLDAQLDFLAKEWKADHNGSATAAGQFGTAEGKIAPIVSKYEVSANQPADIAKRSAYLNQLRAAGIGQGTATVAAPLNPNAGPRVGAVPPPAAPVVTQQDAPLPVPPIPPAVVPPPSQAAIEPSRQATRLNGTDVAGPPGVVPSAAQAAPQPNVILDASGNPLQAPPPAPNKMMAGVGLPGVTIGLPTNGMAPPAAVPVQTAAGPPSPVTQAPAAPAAPPATGVNSPQFQKAQELNRAAADLLTRYPNNPRAQAQAAALKAQAALYMQADSVVKGPGGVQIHTLTGKEDDPAKPLPNYQWNEQRKAFMDPSGHYPPVTPRPGSITVLPDGRVIQSDPGGGVSDITNTDLGAVTARKAAETQGSEAGKDVGKQVPALAAQGRNAATAIGNIDYGMNQVREAAKSGIPTGYFSQGLATAAAAAKSLGIDTTALGVDPAAVGNIQSAQKTLGVVAGAILQQAIGKDSQITDAKIQHFIHTQPGIETDPHAIERVLNWARSQFVYENEMSVAAMKEAADSPTGTLPLNWQPRYYRDKGFAPIYDPGSGEMRQPEGQQPTREPPPGPPPTAPVNPSERKADTVYQTPKGPLRWSGGEWFPVTEKK